MAGSTSYGDGAQRGLVVLEREGGPPPAEGVPERPDFHSFGEVPDGSVATHTFRMRNVESVPIRITGIHPGCGCTAADVRVTTRAGDVIEGQKPEAAGEEWVVIPPDAVVELTLNVDTRDIASKNKDRTLTTRVVTDAEAGRYRTFEVHLFVAQDLMANPKRLSLGEVPVGVGGAGTVDVIPVGERGAEVVGLRSSPDGVRVEVVPSEILGHSTWAVLASIDPPLELGLLFGTIVLETRRLDGSPGHDLEIPFQARVVKDLRVDPARLVLVDRGGDGELFAQAQLSTLRPGERLLVQAAHVEGDGAELFELDVSPEEPDAKGRSHRWNVALRPKGEWPSTIQRGEVVLTLERASEGSVRIPWVCHPR